MTPAKVNTSRAIGAAVIKRMVIAGGKNIELNRAQIDALNVFPVPDGDTGTNMSLTMQSVINGLSQDASAKMDTVADIISKGALKGARGNSGVILSQILKGFSLAISKCDDVDTRTFATAMKRGTELAYSAVSKPREGTILTVVREMSEKAVEIARQVNDYEEFLNQLIASGEDTLARTPDMLDVLKKAGVVDSGGFGLIILFKGFLAGYLNQDIEGATAVVQPVTQATSPTDEAFEGAYVDYHSLDDIEFAYCTEFFIVNLYRKTTLTSIDKLREYLCQIGDSVVVVGDLEMVKVHVHSNAPGDAISHALALGEVDKVKIENMLEQNRQLKKKLDAERKNVGVLSVCAGDGFTSIFKDLLVDQVISGGQTMNPSAEEIANAIKRINANNIIVLPNNKNIILAAEQSRALVEGKDIYVITTKDIPMGIAAMLSYNPESTLPEILEQMNDAITNYRSGSVTYAVRDSSVDGVTMQKGDKIGIDRNKIVCKGDNVNEVTSQLIAKMVQPGDEVITLYYGSDVSEEEANQLVETLTEVYPECDIGLLYGGQPLYYYILSVE